MGENVTYLVSAEMLEHGELQNWSALESKADQIVVHEVSTRIYFIELELLQPAERAKHGDFSIGDPCVFEKFVKLPGWLASPWISKRMLGGGSAFCPAQRLVIWNPNG